MAKENIKSCQGCPALCCRYVSLEIDKPNTPEDWDNIRWYLLHENIIVYIDHENDWMIEFKTKCKKLGPDNRCQIHKSKPHICNEFKAEECEHHNNASPYKIKFESVEELEMYLHDQNIQNNKNTK